MSDLEYRAMAEPVEFRGGANGTKIVASGIAIRYDTPSKPFPRAGRTIREQFRPNAFVKTLQERDVMALHEHDRNQMLGRTSSGTMRVHNGPKEMGYEIDLPDTTAGRDVAVLLERKDVNGSSVGFRSMPKDEVWAADADGLTLRSVHTAMLDHIATTCAPVYDDTAVGLALRSLSQQTGLELRSLIDKAASGELASVLVDVDGNPLERRSDTPSAVGPLLSAAAALLQQAADAYAAEEAAEMDEENAEVDEESAEGEPRSRDDGRDSTVIRRRMAHIF